MTIPWMDPIKFGGLYGGIGGGLLGGLSGLLGGATAILAKSGKGRTFIHTAFTTMLLIGVLHLIVGIYASVSRQPFGITFPLLLIGFVLTVVFAALRPVVDKYYP
jgi:hypothetical protein